MVYEIEKRSLFNSEKEFEKLRKFVAKQGKFVGKFVFKSFLFREPEYLRIRLIQGNPDAVITRKSGDYNSVAREEVNEKINLKDLDSYIKLLKSKGFKNCACVETVSFAYLTDGLRVDFNSMTYLGRIVEVEALADDEEEISKLENKIIELMKRLNLKELSPKEYQSMMDEMYSKGLKPIDKQKFSMLQ